MLRKIISGGQTGVDQAGLTIGAVARLQTGGWAPSGWMTKDGPNPDLMQMHGMQEHPYGYKARTYENVKDSDGTLILNVNANTPGAKCTRAGIRKYKRPCYEIALLLPEPPPAAAAIWLMRNEIHVLNIAGNSEGTNGYQVYTLAYNYLRQLMEILDSKDYLRRK